MPYDVFGIGNALVDIQVMVSDEDLDALMLAKGAMSLTNRKEQERVLGALSGRIDNICSGGSAANTIHGVGALGGRAYYLGRVANDDHGRLYTSDMARMQIGFPGPGDAPSGTGTSLVLITPDAQRTLCTHLGVSVDLGPDNVDETIVADSRAVYIEGYLWDSQAPRAAAIKVAEIANRHSIPVAFTLSDAFLIERYRDDLLTFIGRHVDILFCNETEGKSLSGHDDAASAFDAIADLVSRLFFTLSERGAWVAHEGEKPTAILPFAANKVDTTGAGDLFAAGALYGLTSGLTIQESAILGNYCGSLIVSRMGARLPEVLPSKIDEILDLYSTHHR